MNKLQKFGTLCALVGMLTGCAIDHERQIQMPKFSSHITRFGSKEDIRYLRKGPSFDRVKLYVDLNNDKVYDREFEFQYINPKHKSRHVWPNFVRIYDTAISEDSILNYGNGFIKPELRETINFDPYLSLGRYKDKTQKLLLELGLDSRVLADMKF